MPEGNSPRFEVLLNDLCDDASNGRGRRIRCNVPATPTAIVTVGILLGEGIGAPAEGYEK